MKRIIIGLLIMGVLLGAMMIAKPKINNLMDRTSLITTVKAEQAAAVE